MSISSVHVLLTDSYSVPLCWTSLTQQPSHCLVSGMSLVWAVNTKGSPHRGSSLELQSKHSVSLPDMPSLTERTGLVETTKTVSRTLILSSAIPSPASSPVFIIVSCRSESSNI